MIDSLWLLFDVRGWYHETIVLASGLLEVLAASPSTPELALQEIVLRTSLARALMATKGYTPEVEEAYNRALEISQAAGEGAERFPVLKGLYSLYNFRGEFDKALPIGKKFLELAERYDDSNMRVEAHLILGSSHAFTGNIQLGMEHLEKGIALIDPDRRLS